MSPPRPCPSLSSRPSSRPFPRPSLRPSPRPSPHPSSRPTSRPSRPFPRPSSRPSSRPSRPSLRPSSRPSPRPSPRPLLRPQRVVWWTRAGADRRSGGFTRRRLRRSGAPSSSTPDHQVGWPSLESTPAEITIDGDRSWVLCYRRQGYRVSVGTKAVLNMFPVCVFNAR